MNETKNIHQQIIGLLSNFWQTLTTYKSTYYPIFSRHVARNIGFICWPLKVKKKLEEKKYNSNFENTPLNRKYENKTKNNDSYDLILSVAILYNFISEHALNSN